MLIIDGVKYKLWTPEDEEKEFHPMIKEHSKEIFGEDSIYFDVKHKLKSRSGIGSIPDAYAISLSQPYEWYVVENELATHPIYDHIVKQLTKFMNGLRNPKSRNDILEAIDEDIRTDKVLKAHIEKMIGSSETYRFLAKLLSRSPKIVLVIDELNEEVKEACHSLKYETKFVEFKTFVREDAENVRAHLFEPLYSARRVPEKPSEKPAEKPKRKAPSDEKLLEALVKAYKGKPLTSREVSDAAGIKDPDFGREVVRNAMKRLTAEGKAESVKPTKKMRAKLLYKPKE